MTFDRRRAILEEVKKQFPDYPCFFGFDYLEALGQKIRNNESFVFVDHAYFGRGYEAKNFRVILSDIHQRRVKPRREAKTFAYEPGPWRKGDDIVIFPPSPTIARMFGAENWVEQIKAGLRQHTDRRFVVKHKEAPKPLKFYLQDAHLVVGYGTVACVEAALYGVPVYAGPRCPATPIALTDPSQIESPIYPDREAWFRNLNHSQFHLNESRAGLCRETILGSD